MKKLCFGIISVAFCIVVSSIAITPQVKANDTALTLTFGEESKDYTFDDLLAFDSITGNGGRLKVTGDVIPPYEYTGVLITTLAQEFTDIPSDYSVMAIADDGYIINYSYAEVQGDVMVYDLEGDEIGVGGVSMVLATMENGQTGYSGSLRIVFINDDEPITFSALWAKYVVELVFLPNTSPNKPDKPFGSQSGKVGKEYSYKSVATDNNNDKIMYLFDWGDGTDSGWLGPYDSGVTCEAKHSWDEKNNYEVKVKAKDVYGEESIWSDPLSISIPKDRAIAMPLFKFIEQHTIIYKFLQRFL